MQCLQVLPARYVKSCLLELVTYMLCGKPVAWQVLLNKSCVSVSQPLLDIVSAYLQAIEELPGQESPEIFGLHPNADLTFRTLQVQAAVQIIMDTQPKGAGGGGGLSREEIVDRICEDLLSKVGTEH